MYSEIVKTYLLGGGRITFCRDGYALNRLRWGITSHPTRSIPLTLGIVGRW